MPNNRVTRLARALATAALAVALIALSTAPPAAAGDDVHTAVNPSRSGELVKTIPISTQAFGKARSVISLGPKVLGLLRTGNVVEGSGDIQLTICINPTGPTSGQPCVGEYHDFDPKVKAKLVLAPEPNITGGKQAIEISDTFDFECTERPSGRTRHCVQQVPWSQITVDSAVTDRCRACHLNLVVSVWHPDAKEGHKVVLGTSDDRKRIQQGRSQINAVVYPNADAVRPVRTYRTSRLATERPPVVAHGKNYAWRTVYSQKIGGLQKGDQFLVDATPIVSNNGLPYPTHAHYKIILTDRASGTTHINGFSERIGEVGVPNGFTCTQEDGGHTSPCQTRKFGIVSIGDARHGPYWIKLMIGQDARGTSPEYNRWRSSHRSRMRPDGSMIVRKFRGTMGCGTCAVTRGFQSFSATNLPADQRLAKLVRKINKLGVPRGGVSCKLRRKAPKLVCDWRASGDYGRGTPNYECKQRAFYRKRGWDTNACNQALLSWLHSRLQDRGQREVSVFKCERVSGSEVRCKWNARDGASGLFCRGFGYFDTAKGTWRISACKP